eukprot:4691056-Pyramimonas_sp.AAC.1
MHGVLKGRSKSAGSPSSRTGAPSATGVARTCAARGSPPSCDACHAMVGNMSRSRSMSRCCCQGSACCRGWPCEKSCMTGIALSTSTRCGHEREGVRSGGGAASICASTAATLLVAVRASVLVT